MANKLQNSICSECSNASEFCKEKSAYLKSFLRNRDCNIFVRNSTKSHTRLILVIAELARWRTIKHSSSKRQPLSYSSKLPPPAKCPTFRRSSVNYWQSYFQFCTRQWTVSDQAELRWSMMLCLRKTFLMTYNSYWVSVTMYFFAAHLSAFWLYSSGSNGRSWFDNRWSRLDKMS